MKKNHKILIGAGALLVVIAVMALIFWKFMPAGAAGDKTITVEVVVPDQESKSFSIKTSEAYLGAALQNENLVEGDQGQYGLFITSVNGIKAEESKKQWWCITKDGAQVTTGVDATPIADGEHYELILSTY